jgi:hypothetical protein
VAEVAQTNLQLYNQLIARSWRVEDLARVKGAYDLAARLFSGRYRCSGKPFVDHLVGTASVVADLGERVDMVAAALLHAAYEQGDFGGGRAGRPEARRAAVARAVGSGAEALVFAYGTTPWTTDTLARRRTDADTLDAIERDVIVLRLANEADEHIDLGTRYCDRGGFALYDEDAVAEMALLAERIGVPALAVRLRAIADAERGITVPVPLRSSASGSEVIVPRSARRPFARSARHLLGRARNALRHRPA